MEMTVPHCRRNTRGLQRGATLIEFSLILVALLTLLYGIIVYSIVFVTQQAVAYAAESGADAIAVVDPDDDGFLTLAETVATAEVTRVAAFLPGSPGVTVDDSSALGATPVPGREIRVTVTYNFANWGFLGRGLLPRPDTITGEARINVRQAAGSAT